MTLAPHPAEALPIPRVDRADFITVSLPFVAPFGISNHTWSVKEALLLRLEAGGVVGWGECVADPDPFYASETTTSAAHILRAFLMPRLEPGLPLGVLAVGHTEPDMFGTREVGRIEQIAELVSSFLAQRRAAVRALRSAETSEAERKRQRLFEQIFNAIQEGVNVHAPRRGLVEMNPACLRIMGLTREDAMSRDYKDPRWRTLRPDGTLYGPNEYPAIVTLRTGQAMENVRLGIEFPNGQARWLRREKINERSQRLVEQLGLK